jgi:hypothetical protein
VLNIIDSIKEMEASGYDGVYRARRLMRKLLPDSSEMYEFAEVENYGAPDANQASVGEWLAKIPPRVEENMQILYDFIGPIFFALFAFSLVSSMFDTPREPTRPLPTSQRGMLGAFVGFYILCLSLLTSLVTRYVEVMIPFAILQIAAELWRWTHAVPWLRGEWRATAACVMGLALATPAIGHRFDASRYPEYRFANLPYERLREFVLPGDSIMSPTPADAYVLQANWRILPNDGAMRVRRYAQLTETQWLLVAKAPHNMHQIHHYKHKWYMRAGVSHLEEAGFEPVAHFADGQLALYSIPPTARRPNENSADPRK